MKERCELFMIIVRGTMIRTTSTTTQIKMGSRAEGRVCQRYVVGALSASEASRRKKDAVLYGLRARSASGLHIRTPGEVYERFRESADVNLWEAEQQEDDLWIIFGELVLKNAKDPPSQDCLRESAVTQRHREKTQKPLKNVFVNLQ